MKVSKLHAVGLLALACTALGARLHRRNEPCKSFGRGRPNDSSSTDTSPDQQSCPGALGEGEASVSVDVTAFEGCEVQFEVFARNYLVAGTPEELGGYMRIDNIRLEPGVCPTQ